MISYIFCCVVCRQYVPERMISYMFCGVVCADSMYLQENHQLYVLLCSMCRQHVPDGLAMIIVQSSAVCCILRTSINYTPPTMHVVPEPF